MKKAILATGLAGILTSCGLYHNLHDIRPNMSYEQLSHVKMDSARKKISVWKYKDINKDGTIQHQEIVGVINRESLKGTQANIQEKIRYDNSAEIISPNKGEGVVIQYYTQGQELPKGSKIEFSIYDPTGTQIFIKKLASIGWDGGGVTPQGLAGGIQGGNFIYSGQLDLSYGARIPDKTMKQISEKPGTYTITARSLEGYLQDSTQIKFK